MLLVLVYLLYVERKRSLKTMMEFNDPRTRKEKGVGVRELEIMKRYSNRILEVFI